MVKRDDLIAAIRIVRFELARNGAYLNAAVITDVPGTPELTESNYRSVQALLERNLPAKLRTELALAYIVLPVATQNLAAYNRSSGDRNPSIIEGVRKIENRVKAVSVELLNYLQDSLKAEP